MEKPRVEEKPEPAQGTTPTAPPGTPPPPSQLLQGCGGGGECRGGERPAEPED